MYKNFLTWEIVNKNIIILVIKIWVMNKSGHQKDFLNCGSFYIFWFSDSKWWWTQSADWLLSHPAWLLPIHCSYFLAILPLTNHSTSHGSLSFVALTPTQCKGAHFDVVSKTVIFKNIFWFSEINWFFPKSLQSQQCTSAIMNAILEICNYFHYHNCIKANASVSFWQKCCG